MLRNYFLIALRNFRRQKLFSFLNMSGLALGLASSILIFLYVSDERRYDGMHPHFHNTYPIGSTWSNPDGTGGTEGYQLIIFVLALVDLLFSRQKKFLDSFV